MGLVERVLNAQVEYRINGGAWVKAENAASVSLCDSSLIPSSGAASTTTLLTPPAGVGITDFVTGAASDDSNPAPAVILSDGEYTEIEFNLKAISGVSKGDSIEFRLTNDGAELYKYPVTPQVTMSSSNRLWSLSLSSITELQGLDHYVLRHVSVQATDMVLVSNGQQQLSRLLSTDVRNATELPVTQQKILRSLSFNPKNNTEIPDVQHILPCVLNTKVEYRINGGSWVTAGPDSDVALFNSTYISDSGVDSTTPLLTPLAGVTTTSFVAGVTSDDSNPAPAVSLLEREYTEIEFNLRAISGINKEDIVEFRVTDAGGELYEYTVTPQVTMTSGNRLWAMPVSSDTALPSLEHYVLRHLRVQATAGSTVTSAQQQILRLLGIRVEDATDVTAMQQQILRLLSTHTENTTAVAAVKIVNNWFKSKYKLPSKFATTDVPNAEEFNVAKESDSINQAVLNLLGNFWYEKFSVDYRTLGKISGAVTTKLGSEYLRLLRLVLSSSIINTPVTSPLSQELYAFNKQDAAYTYDPENPDYLLYLSFDLPDVESIEFFHTQLFGSKVILDAGNYFEIVEGTLYFYVDIFSDETILTNSYVYGAGNQVILFWASDVCLQETYLYDRYGRYLYAKQVNSTAYKNLLTALQYFFTQAKSIQNIEAVLNILFGLPYSKAAGETVFSVTTINSAGDIADAGVDLNLNAEADSPVELKGLGWAHRVTTDKNIYDVPLYAELLVAPGQKLEQYQLIGRAHKAHDYISTPDWYNNARFPFELVEELKDFSVINAPTEYHSYLPHRCDGSVEYDGEFRHTGSYQVFDGIDPFANTRSRSEAAGGTEFEQALYALVDQVLKYNLLYFETRLNFENVDYYLDNNIKASFEAIKKGVPSYLYPVIDTSFSAEFMDSIEDLEGSFDVGSNVTPDEDPYFVCPDRSYNGTVLCSNPVTYTYAGSFTHADDVRCYPYGGTFGAYYDCLQEEKNWGGRVTGAEDAVNLFGFYPERTFEPPEEYALFDGTQNYGSAAQLGTHRAAWEVTTGEATLSTFQEDVIPFTEQQTGAVHTGFADQVGSYGGQVGCNNADIHNYGALETRINYYGDGRLYSEQVPLGVEVTSPCNIQCDGSRTYKGYNVTGYTYGDTLPWNVNVTDSLSVFTRKKKTQITLPELSDDLQVFDFHTTRTFEPPEGYYTFDGTTGYDQEILLGTHRSDWETFDGAGKFQDSMEDVSAPSDESANVGAQAAEFVDSVGTYGAGIVCSNVALVTHGALDSKFHKYDGQVSHQDIPLTYFAFTPNAFMCNGEQLYSGYNTTGYTYGENLPDKINVTDDLIVNIRRL